MTHLNLEEIRGGLRGWRLLWHVTVGGRLALEEARAVVPGDGNRAREVLRRERAKRQTAAGSDKTLFIRL